MDRGVSLFIVWAADSLLNLPGFLCLSRKTRGAGIPIQLIDGLIPRGFRDLYFKTSDLQALSSKHSPLQESASSQGEEESHCFVGIPLDRLLVTVIKMHNRNNAPSQNLASYVLFVCRGYDYPIVIILLQEFSEPGTEFERKAMSLAHALERFRHGPSPRSQ
jgi:hypothetical protein